jgi:lambda family phage portal protein
VLIERLRRWGAELLLGRSLEAAGGSWRWQGSETMAGGINAAIHAGGTRVAGRAGYAARNNPHASAGAAVLVSNLVGIGIRPQSLHPDPGVADTLEHGFSHWAEDVDGDGMSWAAMQATAVRTMIEGGESFVRMRAVPFTGSAVPLTLDVLDPRQVPADHVEHERRIFSGIELDQHSRRVAFHVYRHPPDEFAPVLAELDLVRLPADEVCHLYQRLAPGQLRGLSWFAPVLSRLRELDGYEDAVLLKARIAAMLVGVTVDPEGSPVLPTDGRAGGQAAASLEPGSLVNLPPGRDVRFSNPPTADDFEPLAAGLLRSIAAGLGVSYEQISGDMRSTTYSSARVALIERRRFFEQVQHLTIVPMLLRPIWRRWVMLAALTGVIDPEPFERDPEAVMAARFVAPAWGWVDPLKDVQAEIASLAAGFTSRSAIIQKLGRDPDEVDGERLEDAERARRLGLVTAGEDEESADA